MSRIRLYDAAFPVLGSCILLTGCGRAPSINILGSFFPAWILCIAAGIFLTIVIHFLLVRLNLAAEIKPSVVAYPCIAASWTFTLWLIFFS